MTYAGFWKRFAAYVLDLVIIGGIVYVVMIPVAIVLNLDEALINRNTLSVQGSGFLLGWLYWAFMESSARQATFGKVVLGIKVTDIHGARISFGKASLRYFGKVISWAILMIGFIMAAFTEKKQALHDLIAETLVVNK